MLLTRYGSAFAVAILSAVSLFTYGCSSDSPGSSSGGDECGASGYIACPPFSADGGIPPIFTPTCYDPLTSNVNCGGCGIACGADAICINGECACGPQGSSCAADSNCCAGLRCLPEQNGSVPRTCGVS